MTSFDLMSKSVSVQVTRQQGKFQAPVRLAKTVHTHTSQVSYHFSISLPISSQSERNTAQHRVEFELRLFAAVPQFLDLTLSIFRTVFANVCALVHVSSRPCYCPVLMFDFDWEFSSYSEWYCVPVSE